MEAIKSWLHKIGTKIESDIDGSITIQTVREPGGQNILQILDSEILKGCHLFFLAEFWREDCNSSSDCRRQTWAHRELCSLWLRRSVERTPGIPENKTADVQ